MKTFSIARLRSILATVALLATSGCAADVTHWIAQTRSRQGDIALEHLNYPDASVAYQLALKVEPHNDHARTGLVTVQVQIASTDFANSKFEDAIDALAIAAKYSPKDERIAGLRDQIEQAEIKRDIVLSNYPSFKDGTTAIRRSYTGLKKQSDAISNDIRRFEYTYDTEQLTKAIRASAELSEEVARYTNRLVTLRQLVESGAPESKASSSLAPPASLLPLP